DRVHDVPDRLQLLYSVDRCIGPGIIDVEEVGFKQADDAKSLAARAGAERREGALWIDKTDRAVHPQSGVLRELRAEDYAGKPAVVREFREGPALQVPQRVARGKFVVWIDAFQRDQLAIGAAEKNLIVKHRGGGYYVG